MNEDQIHLQVKKCEHLKFKLRWVYAANNYPLNLQTNTFIIVNASRSNSIGTHWEVLAKQYAYALINFADPLALPSFVNCFAYILFVIFIVRNFQLYLM